MSRELLVVAYYYPPVNASGTFRTTSFVGHLSKRGFRTTVLALDNRGEESEDLDLLDRVPPSVRVLRARKWSLPLDRLRGNRASTVAAHEPRRTEPQSTTGGAPAGGPGIQGYSYPESLLGRGKDLLSWFLRFPDRKVGWLIPAVLAGARFLHRNPVEVLYSSGPPHTGHLVAVVLSRMFGIPLVADFRDPWAGNPFNPLPYSCLRSLEEALETLVIRSARWVVAVTPEHGRALRDRHPGVASRIRVITNGYDREVIPPFRGRSAGSRMEILHAGVLYGRRDPFPFLRAVDELCRDEPEIAARLRVSLLGPAADERYGVERLQGTVRAPGVLRVEPGVSHGEALERMVASDVLFLLGPGGAEPEVQIPAKLFEYLGCRRPVLALSHPEGAIACILKDCNELCRQVPPGDVSGIKEAIRGLFLEWEQSLGREESPLSEPPVQFDREVLAESLAKLLGDVTR